jgi:hypothetical protein
MTLCQIAQTGLCLAEVAKSHRLGDQEHLLGSVLAAGTAQGFLESQ